MDTEWVLEWTLVILAMGTILPILFQAQTANITRFVLPAGGLGLLLCAVLTYIHGPAHGRWLWGLVSWSMDMLTAWFLIALTLTVSIMSIGDWKLRDCTLSKIPYLVALCGCLLLTTLLMTMNHMLSFVMVWGILGWFWRLLNCSESAVMEKPTFVRSMSEFDHVGSFALLVGLLLCTATVHSGEFSDLVRSPLTVIQKWVAMACLMMTVGFRCLYMPLLLNRRGLLTDNGSRGMVIVIAGGVYTAYRFVLDLLTPGPLELGMALIMVVAIGYMMWIYMESDHPACADAVGILPVLLLWPLLCLGLVMVYWIQGLTSLCTLTFAAGLTAVPVLMMVTALQVPRMFTQADPSHRCQRWTTVGPLLLLGTPLLSGFISWFLLFQGVFNLSWALPGNGGMWLTMVLTMAVGWAYGWLCRQLMMGARTNELFSGQGCRLRVIVSWIVLVTCGLPVLWPNLLFLLLKPLLTAYTMLDADHLYQFTSYGVRFPFAPLDTTLPLPHLALIFMAIMVVCLLFFRIRDRRMISQTPGRHGQILAWAAALTLAAFIICNMLADRAGVDLFIVFILLMVTRVGACLATGEEWILPLSELGWLFGLAVLGMLYETSDLHAIARFVARRMFFRWQDILLIGAFWFLLLAEWQHLTRIKQQLGTLTVIRLFSLLMLVIYLFWHPGDMGQLFRTLWPSFIFGGLLIMGNKLLEDVEGKRIIDFCVLVAMGLTILAAGV